MSYRVRFRQRARQEFERCRDYGSEFHDKLTLWLSDLADGAEKGTDSSSIDPLQILDEALDGGTDDWEESWRRLWEKAPVNRIRALIAVLRKRSPPCQSC